MKKRILLYIALILILALFFSLAVYLRSERFSTQLKNILIPQLEKATDAEVYIGRVFLNPFPLYLELQEVKIRDKKDHQSLFIKKGRIFFLPSRLIAKQLYLSRIELTDLDLKSPYDKLLPFFAKKARIKNRGFEIIPVEILLNGGTIEIAADSEKFILSNPSIRVNLKKGSINIGNLRFLYRGTKGVKLPLNIKGRLFFLRNGEDIELKELIINDSHSRVVLKGLYRKNKLRGFITGRLSSLSLPLFLDIPSNLMAELNLDGSFSLKNILPERSIKEYLKTLNYRLKLKGFTDLQFLMNLLKEKEPLYGRTYFKGLLKGSFYSPELSLTADMKKGNIYGIDTDEVKTEIRYTQGILSFRNSTIRTYNGTAKAEVEIALPHVRWYSISVMAEDLDSAPLFKLIKWNPGLPSGKVRGYLVSTGKRFSPSGRFIFKSLSRGDGTSLLDDIKHIEGIFHLSGSTLRLKTLNIKTLTSNITSRGLVDLKTGNMSFKFTLNTQNIGDLLKAEGFTGKARIDGNVAGKTSAPVINGRIKATSVNIDGFASGDIQGRLSYSKGIINIHSLVGAMYQGQYTLKGHIYTGSSKPFVIKKTDLLINLSFSSIPVNSVVNRLPIKGINDLEGHISGNAIITGSLKSPEFEAKFQSVDLNYHNIPIGTLKANLSFKDHHYFVDDISIKKGHSLIKGAFFYYGDGQYEIKDGQILLSSKDIPVGFNREIILKGHLWGNSKGSEDKIQFKGILSGKNTELGKIKMNYVNGIIDIGSLLFKDHIRIKGRLSTNKNADWTLSIKANNGRYDELLRYFVKDIPDELVLNLSAVSRLYGRGLNFNGDITFRKFICNLYGYNFVNIGDILLSLKENTLTIDSFRMKAGPATFNLMGDITTSGRINITAYGSSYLTPLKTLISGIESIRGDVDFVLGLTGTTKAPIINGGIVINNTTIELTPFIERIKGITGYAYIDNNRVVIESLSGRFGGGDISLIGSADIGNWEFKNYNIDVTLKDVTLKPLDNVWFSADGQISFSERKGTPLIVGDLGISKARFKRDINWRAMILSRRIPVKTHRAKIGQTELNITLSGDEDILIDNNLVTAPAKIDLLIRGTISNPAILGRIELLGGKFFFRNNEFKIEKASADFVDPQGIYPFFDIIASTRVHDYNITLSLNGYVDEFKLNLNATPYLNEMDILSLLTLGRVTKNLRGLEGGIGVAEATAFLTGQLQNTIEERIQSITGFDRIEVEPYISEKTGEISPRVTVAKRLLSDRLYVTYSTSFGSEAEQFLKLEFALSDNISLVGERDETGTIGADIKFRVEFR